MFCQAALECLAVIIPALISLRLAGCRGDHYAQRLDHTIAALIIKTVTRLSVTPPGETAVGEVTTPGGGRHLSVRE